MHTSSSAHRRVTALLTTVLAAGVLATPVVVGLTSAAGASEVSVVAADGATRKGHTWDRVRQNPAS